MYHWGPLPSLHTADRPEYINTAQQRLASRGPPTEDQLCDTLWLATEPRFD